MYVNIVNNDDSDAQIMMLLLVLQGIRNESIVLAYVKGLCSLDRLITRIGYTRFDQTDMGYLLLNRARRFTGFCGALHRYKKRCKQSASIRRIRDFHPSIKSGTFSPMFAAVNGFSFCPAEVFFS